MTVQVKPFVEGIEMVTKPSGWVFLRLKTEEWTALSADYPDEASLSEAWNSGEVKLRRV
jgi:hypothetical protein